MAIVLAGLLIALGPIEQVGDVAVETVEAREQAGRPS